MTNKVSITPEWLENKRRLAQAATAGNWHLRRTSRHGNSGSNYHVRSEDGVYLVEGHYGVPSLDNAAYITAMDPPSALALVAEVERLWAGREALLADLIDVRAMVRLFVEDIETLQAERDAARALLEKVAYGRVLHGGTGFDYWTCRICRGDSEWHANEIGGNTTDKALVRHAPDCALYAEAK